MPSDDDGLSIGGLRMYGSVAEQLDQAMTGGRSVRRTVWLLPRPHLHTENHASAEGYDAE